MKNIYNIPFSKYMIAVDDSIDELDSIRITSTLNSIYRLVEVISETSDSFEVEYVAFKDVIDRNHVAKNKLRELTKVEVDYFSTAIIKYYSLKLCEYVTCKYDTKTQCFKTVSN